MVDERKSDNLASAKYPNERVTVVTIALCKLDRWLIIQGEETRKANPAIKR